MDENDWGAVQQEGRLQCEKERAIMGDVVTDAPHRESGRE